MIEFVVIQHWTRVFQRGQTAISDDLRRWDAITIMRTEKLRVIRGCEVLLPSDEEVLWLDVSVYEVLGVDELHPDQQLYG